MRSPALIEPNHRILVVDDNVAIHNDLRKILVNDTGERVALEDDEAVLFDSVPAAVTDFQVDSAYQGEEGLEKLQQAVAAGRPYALAFVDVRMPGCSREIPPRHWSGFQARKSRGCRC